MAFCSPLQVSNLEALRTLRQACSAQPREARLLYGVPAAALPCYAALTDADALSLAAELDVSVIVPRYEAAHLRAAAQSCSAFLGTPLQVENLRFLQALVSACRAGEALAAWRYRLAKPVVAAYAALTDAEVVHAAASLGDSAGIPRFDCDQLASLLLAPQSARGRYAAVCDAAPAVHLVMPSQQPARLRTPSAAMPLPRRHADAGHSLSAA